jgi:hypothetical protein
MLNWDHERWQGGAGAELFEKLCVDLLIALGFRDVDWRKGHPDEGWDIESKYDVQYPTGPETEIWYVQCKRYALDHGVPPTKIDTKRLEMQARRPTCLLLITNSFFLPKVKDWAKSCVGYRVELWEGERLEGLIRQHGNLVLKYFPEIAKSKGDLIAQVTHALRASLQHVMSHVFYLESLVCYEEGISDDFKHKLADITNATRLMAREYERFYFFSTMETVTYSFSNTSIGNIIKKSASKFEGWQRCGPWRSDLLRFPM